MNQLTLAQQKSTVTSCQNMEMIKLHLRDLFDLDCFSIFDLSVFKFVPWPTVNLK